MTALILLVIRFFRSVRAGLEDPEFRALFFTVVGVIGLGTLFYSAVEHWRPLDAFYFTIVTLATVGYGDFAPKTDLGKIFTVFYLILGISLLSGFLVLLAERNRIIRRSRLAERAKKKTKK